MNSTASVKKHRPPARRRIAAATAGALGAALLIPPGTASAQEEVDCSALGDNPMEGTVELALEAADACGVEVRIENRSWPYATLYATPEGQLHLLSTADAVQDYEDDGPYDPTLTAWGGSLMPTSTFWDIYLTYTEGGYPLLETTRTGLAWNGPIPVPTYSGTTAVYDELAAGLDLTVDVDTASAGLAFDIADADAWNSLASGFFVTSANDLSVVDGTLQAQNPDSRSHPAVTDMWTTTFTVRDADGTVTTADLALDDSGALTISLPGGALDTAAYPLTLSTRWAIRAFPISEWGSVTSAAPGMGVFHGEAGLGEPYFEAAGENGDALVGAYCDALADPACASTSEAATYWNFIWPELRDVEPYTNQVDFTFPVSSASFRVDAAEGATCVAPDLQLTEEYSPAATAANRPAVIGAAASGACQDGTAVYDVTETLSEIWGDADAASTASFGMTESAETARFDGGSARLDVYFDVVGFHFFEADDEPCSWDESAPAFSTRSTPRIGNFNTNVWRPELTGPGLTWTATFYDADTGQERFTTDASEVTSSSNERFLSESEAVDDGSYKVVYDISSPTADFEYRSEPCYLVVDTAVPEAVSISVEPGQHYVGDVITVDFTVADEGFPGGGRSLTVDCDGYSYCVSEPLVLTDSASGSLEVKLTHTDGTVALEIRDEASNYEFTDEIPVPATRSHRDYDGDRHQDMIAVRRSDGDLVFYAGRGDGTYEDPVSVGSGWNEMDVVMAGDLTSDGLPDILARDNTNGYLYTYPGDGEGGFGTRMHVGTGWDTINSFTSAGDFDGDGNMDIVGLRAYEGGLFFYPGRGDGTFGSRSLASSTVSPNATISTVGSNAREGTYHILIESRGGRSYYFYASNGDGTFRYQTQLESPVDIDGDPMKFSQFTAAGDIDGDNYEDVVAIDARTRELVRLSLETTSPMEVVQVIDGDWDGVRLPSAVVDAAYDYNGDGNTDVVARNASDERLYRYQGDGKGSFNWSNSWGTGWGSMDLIEAAGDTNGDGRADLLARHGSTGVLYLYESNGYGSLEARQIGTGWGSMRAVVSGHDFDGDGIIDIIAHDGSTGYLWLYPGNGDGTVTIRQLIGTGWNSMREITATGDLDHDGHADLIAINKTNDCLYRYNGSGQGTIASRTQIGCGWDSMDQLAGIGDFNNDGHTDWIARLTTNGNLYLYQGNGQGGHSRPISIGTGWNSMDAIA